MSFNLRNRSFLKELDFTAAEWKFLLKLAAELKAAKYAGTEVPRISGKNIAVIFAAGNDGPTKDTYNAFAKAP